MGAPIGVVEIYSARNCRPCKGAAWGGCTPPPPSPLLRHYTVVVNFMF